MLNDNNLLLIYFVRKQSEIWKGGFKDQLNVDEAWEHVCYQIHGNENFDRREVNKLKESWRTLRDDYKHGYPHYREYLSFLDNRTSTIVKPTDFSVSKYGDVVGYDKVLFSEDEFMAMKAVALMKRVYEAKRSGTFTDETIDADEDGSRKWKMLFSEQVTNEKDKQRTKNRFKKDGIVNKQDRELRSGGNRFNSNRHRWFGNQEGTGFGASSTQHESFGGFGGGFNRETESGNGFADRSSTGFGTSSTHRDPYGDYGGFGGFGGFDEGYNRKPKRGNRFERRCSSGFGAYDAPYRPFGSGTSSFERKGFEEEKPSRGFARPSECFDDSYRPFGQPNRNESSTKPPRKNFDESDEESKSFNSRFYSRFDSKDYGNTFGGFCASENGMINHFRFPREKEPKEKKCGFGGQDSESEAEQNEDTHAENKLNTQDMNKKQEEYDRLYAEKRHKSINEGIKDREQQQKIRNDAKNYEEYYNGGENKTRFLNSPPKKTVKPSGAGKKTEKTSNKKHSSEVKRQSEFNAPARRRHGRLSDENALKDDFDSVSEGEPYFNSAEQEFSDEEYYKSLKEKNSTTSTGTVIERNPKIDASDASQKEPTKKSDSQKKAKKFGDKPIEDASFPAHTQFGDFDVSSEELADAITWLNEPANQLTIKLVKNNRSRRSGDIERLILKKLDLQSDYLMHWFQNYQNQNCKSLPEFKFLQKQGIPVTLEASILEQHPLVAANLTIATTPYGPVKTDTANQACFITFLNDPDNFDKILNAQWDKKTFSPYLNKSIEEIKRTEENFIRWWKLNNLGEPLNKLQMSEMKWIVSKEHGVLGFDEIRQKKLVEQLEEKRESYIAGYKTYDKLVKTRGGRFLVTDPEVAFALNWLEKHSGECKEAKKRLALGSLGAMDQKINSFLNTQLQFLEDFKNGKFNKHYTDSSAALYCSIIEEERHKESKEADECKNLDGAPADPIERNVALNILNMEKEKRRNWAGIWAPVRGGSIRTTNEHQADAIAWLNEPDNAATLDEVKRKLRNKLKLGDIDQAIVAKMKHERNFVKAFRADRTDFELNVLSPRELKFVQEKERLYRLVKTTKKSEPDDSSTAEQTAAVEKRVSPTAKIIEKEPMLLTSEVFEAVVHEGIETQANDISVRFINSPQPSVAMDMFAAIRREAGSLVGSDTTLGEAETIEVGVEQIAEELNEEGLEPSTPTPSISSFDMITGSGSRTEQLTRMMTDLLSEMERSNPAEYQSKEEAILKMLGN